MEEEEKGRGFKVQDRRRFSSEGEAKPEAEETPARSESESETAAKPGQSGPGDTSFTIGGQSRGPSPEEASGAQPEMNFATFLVGLSGEALAALGEMPNPVTGETRRDLLAAQQLIDIIAILKEKTRGNLDQYEQNLIDAILFDLRMKYVELARPQAR